MDFVIFNDEILDIKNSKKPKSIKNQISHGLEITETKQNIYMTKQYKKIYKRKMNYIQKNNS